LGVAPLPNQKKPVLKRSEEEIAQAPQEIWIPAINPSSDDGAQQIVIPPNPNPGPKPGPKPIARKLPASVDWRKSGKVAPVRMQGYNCGSCAFHASVEAIESTVAIKHHKKVTPLSVQQAIDCLAPHCYGSNAETIVPWVHGRGGLAAQSRYPLVNSQWNSRFVCKSAKPFTTAVGYQKIAHNVKAMQQWVAFTGPLYVVVNGDALQNYKSGVLDAAHCSPRQNHAVLIVGYKSLNGHPVWIIKNSWSNKWGVGGYLYLSRSGNACGVNTNPIGILV